ncbi:VOC family protein [Actinoplanes sp. NPDC023714]|uniref:VOC family protein n=1 Tax=Actinoplanes sp. NPDC023714 TaxID=3154322 RepID=UPI0033EC22C5
MPSRWEQVVVGAEDPPRLAGWWAEALGYVIVAESPDRVEIRRTPSELPALLFVPVTGTGARTVRNRLHLDLRPDDHESEVERLVGMGARLVDPGRPDPGRPDPGRPDPGRIVLADPEGNEFCVLPA